MRNIMLHHGLTLAVLPPGRARAREHPSPTHTAFSPGQQSTFYRGLASGDAPRRLYTIHASRDSARPSRTCRGHILIGDARWPGLLLLLLLLLPCTPHTPPKQFVVVRSLVVSYLIENKKKITGVEEMEREREKERGRGRLLHPDRNLIARYLFPLPCTASEIS